MPDKHDIAELLDNVCGVLKGCPQFKKVTRTKLQVFALEISLVALGVRTGYLFDAFTVSNAEAAFCLALKGLREKIKEFNEVVVGRSTRTADYFFLNVKLLLQRCREESNLGCVPSQEKLPALLASHPSWVAFVFLEGPVPSLLSALPSSASDILSGLYHSLESCVASQSPIPLSISLPVTENTSCADIITLAAILLEYPVAYAPAPSSQMPFLSDVELEIYSCTLAFNHADGQGIPLQHTFMQFSCPKILEAVTEYIAGRLQERFSDRIQYARLDCQLAIVHRTERLARVAL